MNEKNTKYLFQTYPKLYSTKDDPLTVSLMGVGFECGDGWFDIIDKLSERIENYNNNIPDNVPICTACQVKEKYGALRFYINNGSDEVYDWLNEAEDESETTCEICGKTGKFLD